MLAILFAMLALSCGDRPRLPQELVSIGNDPKRQADRLPGFLAVEVMSQNRILTEIIKHDPGSRAQKMLESDLLANLARMDYLLRTVDPKSTGGRGLLEAARQVRQAQPTGELADRWKSSGGLEELGAYEPVLPAKYDVWQGAAHIMQGDGARLPNATK